VQPTPGTYNTLATFAAAADTAVTPANYLLTTAHNLVNLDALKAANPGKCCIPLPGGPASVAFMNTDLYYVATKSDCTDKLTSSQYPAMVGFVYACGCKGGPCNSKGGEPPISMCAALATAVVVQQES
jgi:hypothetical protein